MIAEVANASRRPSNLKRSISALRPDSSVELFPVVGLATGTILGAADVCRAGPHSTPRSTNVFLKTLSGGVSTGPEGWSYRHRSPRYTAVRWAPTWMPPFWSARSTLSSQFVSISQHVFHITLQHLRQDNLKNTANAI